MGKDFASQYMATVKKLREEGKSFIEASELADLDMKINQWPKNWGEDLQASIYGGFLEIQVKVELPELGITIEPEKEVLKKRTGEDLYSEHLTPIPPKFKYQAGIRKVFLTQLTDWRNSYLLGV